ncbi:MAG: YqjF family protein, partial [Planctomyces sp.]
MNTPFPEDNVTAGYQEWRRLLFLHWRVPVEDVQRLLPRGLEVDEFDGSAWLGVVPFSMERIRPWWSPAVPGISWFLETNVRTYVVDRQGVRGVWFFSLDADQWLAVKIARRFWYLPYRHAVLSLQQSGG